jgi:hypothetical protein
MRQFRLRAARLAAAAITACMITAVSPKAAEASSIVDVWGDPAFGLSLGTISNFYSALPGVTSTIITGQLNTNNLSGVNLLWAVQPADAYTAAELTTMANFLAGGGRIAFMGEHGFIAPNQNAFIQAAIATLGGHVTINVDAPDGGFHQATVGNGQILSHPLTTGVNTYDYAAFASLNLSGAAVPLMLGTNHADVMMAYENIGPGSIFLITDQNVWDHVSDPSFDNHRMFENLLLGNTGAPPPPPPNGAVPEPATLVLLGSGVAVLVGNRVRRAKVKV